MSAKILLLDIETQPDVVYVWGVYQTDAIAVKSHWQVLSFSAKWLGGKHITKGLPDYPGYRAGGDDASLLKDVWRLLDEADIVVAHNGADFDLKKLTARFIAHGMRPPSPYRIVDTKRALKQVAAFSSNKLDWLAQQLSLGKKLQHQGWGLWLGCINGEAKAWETMKKYNAHDVVLLEKLYKAVSPWIRQPNGGVWLEGQVCANPSCGSTRLERRGLARNKTRVYQRFQCKKCGAWSRSPKAEPRKVPLVGT